MPSPLEQVPTHCRALAHAQWEGARDGRACTAVTVASLAVESSDSTRAADLPVIGFYGINAHYAIICNHMQFHMMYVLCITNNVCKLYKIYKNYASS